MVEKLATPSSLPVGSGKRSTGWWGLWTLIITEGSLFGYLILAYFYLATQTGQHWPPDGTPKLLMPGVNTAVLLTSSVFVALCERCVRRNRLRLALLPMAIAIVLGVCFLSVQWQEWAKKPYGMATNLYGSLYFTITGFHMAHVVVGLIILMFLMLWIRLGYFNKDRYAALTIGGIYWHFVDAVWLVIFSVLYLVPYAMGM